MTSKMHKILNVNQVLELTGFSRTTLYDQMRQSRFPAPIHLTSRRIGWPEDEITLWIEQKISARNAAHA